MLEEYKFFGMTVESTTYVGWKMASRILDYILDKFEAGKCWGGDWDESVMEMRNHAKEFIIDKEAKFSSAWRQFEASECYDKIDINIMEGSEAGEDDVSTVEEEMLGNLLYEKLSGEEETAWVFAEVGLADENPLPSPSRKSLVLCDRSLTDIEEALKTAGVQVELMDDVLVCGDNINVRKAVISKEVGDSQHIVVEKQFVIEGHFCDDYARILEIVVSLVQG